MQYLKYMKNLLWIHYTLLFIRGGIFTCICGIDYLLVFLFDIETDAWNFNAMFDTNKVLILLIIVFNLLLNIFRILTIQCYNPLYRYVADVLVLFYLFIQHSETIFTHSVSFGIIYGIGLLIIIISILIYQEIIIIKICGMDKDTSKQINQRGHTDFLTNEILNNSLDSIESEDNSKTYVS